MYAIEAYDLQKKYGIAPVLRGLNLRVEGGEVYGLLGPNGAGKSTLIHLLLGFIYPQGGRLSVLGTTPKRARARVGYLPERVRYHIHCSPREYLHDLGVCSNMRGTTLDERCDALLDLVGLTEVANRRMNTFSKGMLQRMGIAQALIHSPSLLLVDEPTSGLDPAGQQELIDLLIELRRRGQTILLCSHQLIEVQALCDRVGFLVNGQLADEVRVADREDTAQIVITTKAPLSSASIAALNSLGADVIVNGCQVRINDDDTLQAQVLRILLDSGERIAQLCPARDELLDLYRRVTNSG